MISLNFRDSRPIYEQIKDDLRRLVVSGVIAEGEKLPSVRQLAAELAINPNTIQRAYTELENEGYLETQPGRGSYAASRSRPAPARRELLLRRFDETAAELLFWGVSPTELSDRLTHLAGEKGENSDDPGQKRG